MKTLDLTAAVPDTITMLQDRGEPASANAVLETLGVLMAPTLLPSAPMETTHRPDGELLSLGRFQLLAELGRGGMGRVLEAKDPDLRRSVAIKVIIDPTRVSEAQLSRFVAEAQITSQLQHPNIVPVYEMGVTLGGDIFFAMKRVEGRSLRQVLAALRDGDEATTIEWTRTKLLHAFIQVCNAVAYAHDRGVLHRDLKPDNVMLGPFGEVLLMDWGVARLMGDVTEPISSENVDPASTEVIERVAVAKTLDGAAIGTPGFMSPEQAQGHLHELDERSDVWSLGIVLYELLTLEPAYSAPSAFALMFAATTGPPEDPRARTPSLNIPEEIAQVCLQALAQERRDRFASASELATAVEAFLAGSKRREAALRHVAEAEAAWAQYGALATEREELLAREQALGEAQEPWAPLEEKADLRTVRRRLGGIDSERTDRFSDVLAACEKAHSQDPGNDAASALLARVHYARFEEAEAARDEQDLRFHAQRVRLYDDGRYAPLLKGTGALTLHTDPPGAEVVCERYDTSADLVWPLVERRVLGTTPLEQVSLEQGSYLLTLRSAGKRDTRYPVFISRGRHWDSGDAPVPLYTDAEVGAGFVYVPPGPFALGGDDGSQRSLPRGDLWLDGFFLAVFPVTMQDYCDFINALHAADPEEAWSRVPRLKSMAGASGGQFWARADAGESYVVPAVDADGDPWDPRWPVFSVSWRDAQAYAAWRSRRDGFPVVLPAERQWEKAARGVDGRIYPWGDGFDATLCKMRDSRAGRRLPEPVGAFPSDASPYGVRDLAGGMRDLCGDEAFENDPSHRPARGGSWNNYAARSRLPTRGGDELWAVYSNTGFRIARPAATSGPQGSE